MTHPLDVDRTSDGYAPLASYAALGDGRTVCLLAADGRIDWLPVPSLDAPPLFAALLDARRGGTIELRPTAPARSRRRYVPGTNVMETIWHTADGSAVVQDALVTGTAGRLPWTQLDRVVRGLSGRVAFDWRVAPGDLLDGAEPTVAAEPGRKVVRVRDVRLAVATDAESTDAPGEPEFRGELVVKEDETRVISLTATSGEPLPLPRVEVGGVERTIRAWREWSSAHRFDGPHEAITTRSALALKLLIHSPTGAIAAAATTSLPEDPAGGKNWDYRFAWTRDLAFTVRALVRFGLTEETHAAMRWMLDTIESQGGEMPIFFTLDGRVSDDVRASSAPGWRGIGPVLVGNRAANQRQLGVYGNLLTIAREYVAAGHVLDDRARALLTRVGDLAARGWHRRDSGIWELQKARHYVTSKFGCWQALDSCIWLAERGHLHGNLRRWRRERAKVAAWIMRRGWNPRVGAYTMHPGSTDLDASVLLFVGVGFPDTERLAGSVDEIARRLSAGAHLYRYSGMNREEEPFVACGFWLVSALTRLGRQDEAEQLFERLAATSNDVGLFSEMVSPTGELWGNAVQALSHLALINAAIDLDETRER
ncbi:MAG: glycoside hydrolase family 15 protein [Microbacterium sp.]|uniref:glycoside hydrolase family 15 protein n=1 Tax=Microbacterium sp. TaxID=51671 RepID=UPI0009288400|nr:glycoside hydrolase family 15 protein [Microbacterium sp.]MBN9173736.1 glycoside hydrolase family 15 protein [Microbacterium sp.]MBN9189713.1 glycoside hydrolase family 15 protein [Microbacterium sp.]MBN9192525.1 glycoside hydrolase family 15 protein [Microbacterium sp.]OJU59342.1 MAG: hypothetical protein BGO04_15320 [Microbacterium sp. 70-38]